MNYQVLVQEAIELKNKLAVTVVESCPGQYISSYFAVPKPRKVDQFRPILNLKLLRTIANYCELSRTIANYRELSRTIANYRELWQMIRLFHHALQLMANDQAISPCFATD